MQLALLFLAAVVPFARQLLLGAGFLDDDVFLQSLPAWEWLSRTLAVGDSPLWSPEMMGGFPIAFTQYPFLYPPDLLLARLLPPFQAYAWSLVLHIFLAGALAYWYGRIIGLGRSASLLAALSFQLSSEVVAGSSGFAARSAFALPGGLLAVELVLQRGPRRGPVAALVVAAALLGGHPQLVLFCLAASVAYALFRLAMVACASGLRRAAVLGGWLALAASLGAAGAAVRLLPTWEVVAISTRAAGLPAEAAGGALAAQGLLVGHLLPLTRLQTLPWGAPGYAGPAALVLAILGLPYLIRQPLGRFFLALGLLAALLSLGDATPLHSITRLPLLSLFREPSRFSLLSTFSLAILGGTALQVLSSHVLGPVHPSPPRHQDTKTPRGPFGVLVSSCLGGSGNRWGKLDRCMAPSLGLLASVSLLLTAALFGLGAFFQYGAGPAAEGLRDWSERHFVDLLNPLRPRMALALLGLPATLTVLALAARGRLTGRGLEGALVALSLVVLVPVAAILNPALDPGVAAWVPESVRFLQRQDGSFRVFGHRPGMRVYNHMHYHGPSGEAGFGDDLRYRFQAEMLAPVLNLRWGIDSADGYEQLHSSHQETLLRYLDSERVSNWVAVSGRWAHLNMEERLRLLRMLNVRFLLSGADLTPEAPDLELVDRIDVEPGAASRLAPPVFVLEVPNPLPGYYLVSNARRFDSDTDALDALAAGNVDPGSTVLLSGDEVAAAGGIGAAEDRGAPRGEAEIVSRRNAEVVLRVSTDRPAYLVTSDSYWPGWRVFVDGREMPVLRANVAGRAVWLEEGGTHRVVYRFEPPGFSAGLAVSLLVGAVWLGWASLTIGGAPSRKL